MDSSSELEPEGLIPSHPLLRPADVLSGAFHNGRLAAVDVGVVCPFAAGSGLDCVQTMHDRKHLRMWPFWDELGSGAISYRPFVVSCWGRLHPDALQMLRNLAKRLARREGRSSQRVHLDRLLARVNVEVMRRAARMVRDCLPRGDSADDGAFVEAGPGTSADLAPVDPVTEQRAGHPSTVDLPLYC